MDATKKYKVYYLPKCNYCGVTSRPIDKRLWEHRHTFGRDTSGCIILSEFEIKKEALKFEKEYQLNNNADGYGFGEQRIKEISDRCRKQKPSSVRRKKIICINTGEVFNSVRECAKKYASHSGNLSKHLKGHPQHKTFRRLKFKYYV